MERTTNYLEKELKDIRDKKVQTTFKIVEIRRTLSYTKLDEDAKSENVSNLKKLTLKMKALKLNEGELVDIIAYKSSKERRNGTEKQAVVSNDVTTPITTTESMISVHTKESPAAFKTIASPPKSDLTTGMSLTSERRPRSARRRSNKRRSSGEVAKSIDKIPTESSSLETITSYIPETNLTTGSSSASKRRSRNTSRSARREKSVRRRSSSRRTPSEVVTDPFDKFIGMVKPEWSIDTEEPLPSEVAPEGGKVSKAIQKKNCTARLAEIDVEATRQRRMITGAKHLLTDPELDDSHRQSYKSVIEDTKIALQLLSIEKEMMKTSLSKLLMSQPSTTEMNNNKRRFTRRISSHATASTSLLFSSRSSSTRRRSRTRRNRSSQNVKTALMTREDNSTASATGSTRLSSSSRSSSTRRRSRTRRNRSSQNVKTALTTKEDNSTAPVTSSTPLSSSSRSSFTRRRSGTRRNRSSRNVRTALSPKENNSTASITLISLTVVDSDLSLIEKTDKEKTDVLTSSTEEDLTQSQSTTSIIYSSVSTCMIQNESETDESEKTTLVESSSSAQTVDDTLFSQTSITLISPTATGSDLSLIEKTDPQETDSLITSSENVVTQSQPTTSDTHPSVSTSIIQNETEGAKSTEKVTLVKSSSSRSQNDVTRSQSTTSSTQSSDSRSIIRKKSDNNKSKKRVTLVESTSSARTGYGVTHSQSHSYVNNKANKEDGGPKSDELSRRQRNLQYTEERRKKSVSKSLEFSELSTTDVVMPPEPQETSEQLETAEDETPTTEVEVRKGSKKTVSRRMRRKILGEKYRQQQNELDSASKQEEKEARSKSTKATTETEPESSSQTQSHESSVAGQGNVGNNDNACRHTDTIGKNENPRSTS